MKILKFGGSSLATPPRVASVTKIVAAARAEGEIAVVVSAFGGVTDSLLAVAHAAEQRDELALEIILETARYLGVGIVSLIHTIDPDGVVLGGAMTFGGGESELGRRFLERIRQEVRQRAFPVLAEKVQVDFASLGGDAGYIGAAGIARLAHRKATSA